MNPSRELVAPSRKNALANGLKFYQGPPCKKGHQGVRYAIGAHCISCTKGSGKAKADIERFGHKSKMVEVDHLREELVEAEEYDWPEI